MPEPLVRIPSRRNAIAAALAALLLAGAPAAAQDVPGGPTPNELRLVRPGQADIVLPAMNAARGRVYFASRGCVVCHQVNGVGGSLAPAFNSQGKAREIELFYFITRMWRGAASMVALQDALFGEPIDLTPEELADIVAFLHDPKERAKFSENDIPPFIRDFMSAQRGAPRR